MPLDLGVLIRQRRQGIGQRRRRGIEPGITMEFRSIRICHLHMLKPKGYQCILEQMESNYLFVLCVKPEDRDGYTFKIASDSSCQKETNSCFSIYITLFIATANRKTSTLLFYQVAPYYIQTTFIFLNINLAVISASEPKPSLECLSRRQGRLWATSCFLTHVVQC